MTLDMLAVICYAIYFEKTKQTFPSEPIGHKTFEQLKDKSPVFHGNLTLQAGEDIYSTEATLPPLLKVPFRKRKFLIFSKFTVLTCPFSLNP